MSRRVEPANYKVKLEIFEGPLDLLLYLIKKDEIDIQDISIERITKQYLAYIETFKILNIDLASEFIVMAANLMYIKSRTLLPKSEQPPEEDIEEEDPRWELIRQLIEYKKFKDAAGILTQKALEQEDYFIAHTPEKPESAVPDTPQLSEISIFDLIRAFQNVLKRFEESHDLGDRQVQETQFGQLPGRHLDPFQLVTQPRSILTTDLAGETVKAGKNGPALESLGSGEEVIQEESSEIFDAGRRDHRSSQFGCVGNGARPDSFYGEAHSEEAEALEKVSSLLDGERSDPGHSEAIDGDHQLSEEHVLVGMGLHTGTAVLGGDNYVGMDVHIAARVSAAALAA